MLDWEKNPKVVELRSKMDTMLKLLHTIYSENIIFSFDAYPSFRNEEAMGCFKVYARFGSPNRENVLLASSWIGKEEKEKSDLELFAYLVRLVNIAISSLSFVAFR